MIFSGAGNSSSSHSRAAGYRISLNGAFFRLPHPQAGWLLPQQVTVPGELRAGGLLIRRANGSKDGFL
jgi:hypothetical protein